jgi:hypothetical protein
MLHYATMSPPQVTVAMFPISSTTTLLPIFFYNNIVPLFFSLTTSPYNASFILECSHAPTTTIDCDNNDDNLWWVWGLGFRNV